MKKLLLALMSRVLLLTACTGTKTEFTSATSGTGEETVQEVKPTVASELEAKRSTRSSTSRISGYSRIRVRPCSPKAFIYAGLSNVTHPLTAQIFRIIVYHYSGARSGRRESVNSFNGAVLEAYQTSGTEIPIFYEIVPGKLLKS